MGYPKYSQGVERLRLLTVTKRNPLTVCKSKNEKVLKILVSELTPPVCKLVKDLASSAGRGAVPIKFASRDTVAKLCPPPVCDCKPCDFSARTSKNSKNSNKSYKKYQESLSSLGSSFKPPKGVRLLFKIAYIAGSIGAFWYVGGFGPTWDSWNLKECAKNSYYSCNNVEFIYRDKCCPGDLEKSICRTPTKGWNEMVFCLISGTAIFYKKAKEFFYEEINQKEFSSPPEKRRRTKKKREPTIPVLQPKPKEGLMDRPTKKPEKSKKKKKELKEQLATYFDELDPMSIKSKMSTDYWCLLYKMRHEDDECD